MVQSAETKGLWVLSRNWDIHFQMLSHKGSVSIIDQVHFETSNFHLPRTGILGVSHMPRPIPS